VGVVVVLARVFYNVGTSALAFIVLQKSKPFGKKSCERRFNFPGFSGKTACSGRNLIEGTKEGISDLLITR